MAEPWYRCTECRKDIPFASVYWQCSVSTCNRARMPLRFCSVVCWDSHLSGARHRDAWAVEAKAPTREAWVVEQAAEAAKPPAPTLAATPDSVATARIRPPIHTPHMSTVTPAPMPVRRVIGEAPPAPAPAADGVHLADIVDRDMLVVISKLKKYIKDRSGMSCSDAVADVLSDHLRVLCDDSIRAAARADRKTILERDVPRPRR